MDLVRFYNRNYNKINTLLEPWGFVILENIKN